MDAVTALVMSALGAEISASRPLQGGDLSEVRRLTLTDGRDLVAKLGPLVAREARMLRAIRAAGAPAPEVLAAAGRVLLLDYLPETAASLTGWAALGHGLKILHAFTGADFGWDEDYAFGAVTISNPPAPDWPTFWAERRLLTAPGALPGDLARRLEALATRLPDLVPRTPPASLLHGDLWTGNVLFSHDTAFLIDPACYYGHAEVDLAMLELFGSPPPAFRDAYGAPEPGWPDRRAAYQLWPALVHLRLFGSGYRPMVEARLASLGV